jgi:hypothetical protein
VGDHIDEGAVGQARIGGHEVSQPKVIVLSWSAERIGPVLGTYVLAETMAVMRTRELGIRAAPQPPVELVPTRENAAHQPRLVDS